MRSSTPRAFVLIAAAAIPSALGVDVARPCVDEASLTRPKEPARPSVDRRGGAGPHHDHPLRRLMRRLGAHGGALELPGGDDGAAALAHFARALDDAALERGTATVVAFGNSLIASDGVTDVLRDRLTKRFGDGGRGFVLADRLAAYGPRARTAERAWGWRAETTADGERPSSPLGLAGAQHVSDGPAYSRFDVAGAARATVHWRAGPGVPRLSWRVGGGAWARLEGTGHGPQQTRLELPADATTLELRAAAAGAVVQGVALEGARPGVVLDVFGVPSADANLWLDTDEALFSAQLASRAPDLVMVLLGGNEAKRLAWGRATRGSTEQHLRAFLARVQAAAPGASCLVVGPIDAVVVDDASPGANAPFRQRPQLAPVIALERRVARAAGCAFFDLYAAMGGQGSLERLDAAGLLHDDRTHPRDKGLDVLGQLLADALLDAYAQAPVDAPAARPTARHLASRP